MIYIVFGNPPTEYWTYKAAKDAFKRAFKNGHYYQIWCKYPDGSMTRWL